MSVESLEPEETHRTWPGEEVWDRTPKVWVTVSKWDCIKVKNFCKAKETTSTVKRRPTALEEV